MSSSNSDDDSSDIDSLDIDSKEKYIELVVRFENANLDSWKKIFKDKNSMYEKILITKQFYYYFDKNYILLYHQKLFERKIDFNRDHLRIYIDFIKNKYTFDESKKEYDKSLDGLNTLIFDLKVLHLCVPVEILLSFNLLDMEILSKL